MVSRKKLITLSILTSSLMFTACTQDMMVGVDKKEVNNKVVLNKGEKDILFKYDEKGRLTTKIYYETGKRQKIKKIKTFYTSGEVKEEMNYSNGFLHGLSRVWYESNKLKMMVNFRNDKPDGEEKWFYENGTIKSIVSYKKGLLHGKIKIYYPTGELNAEIMFQNNEPVENEKIYYKTGELKYVTDFNNGIIKDSF